MDGCIVLSSDEPTLFHSVEPTAMPSSDEPTLFHSVEPIAMPSSDEPTLFHSAEPIAMPSSFTSRTPNIMFEVLRELCEPMAERYKR
jgi:hypothetical protein